MRGGVEIVRHKRTAEALKTETETRMHNKDAQGSVHCIATPRSPTHLKFTSALAPSSRVATMLRRMATVSVCVGERRWYEPSRELRTLSYSQLRLPVL